MRKAAKCIAMFCLSSAAGVLGARPLHANNFMNGNNIFEHCESTNRTAVNFYIAGWSIAYHCLSNKKRSAAQSVSLRKPCSDSLAMVFVNTSIRIRRKDTIVQSLHLRLT
jgi:hypothetical protein